MIENTTEHDDIQTKIDKLKELPINDLLFDPQGRIIAEVDGAVVSADVSIRDDINDKFYQILKNNNVNDEIVEKYKNTEKTSIIPLQQELFFHMSLVKRVYQKVFADKLESAQLDELFKQTMQNANTKIMDIFAKSLKNSYIDGQINIAKLNEILDKSRVEVAKFAHLDLSGRLKSYGITSKDIKSKKKELKKEVESTTATGKNIIHVDTKNKIVTLIEKSEATAHNRKKGTQFAHKKIITRTYENGKVTENNSRLQIRTPSPVVKKGFATEREYVEDVETKLRHIRDKYSISERQRNKTPKAFIYNRYTAINDRLGDMGGNRQTKSQRHILLGAHKYNKTVSSTDGPYCFVQNISVNGFGDTLGYEGKAPITRESTLMTEMAILHTVRDVLNDSGSKLDSIYRQYKQFLDERDSPEYFSFSGPGVNVMQKIDEIKNDLHIVNDTIKEPEDISSQAKVALVKILQKNLHYNHKYAKLVQTLSVFAADASIGGCKSGNERAQSINGRVAIFDMMAANPNGYLDLKESLVNLVQADPLVSLEPYVRQLNTSLNMVYNQRGMQHAASLISLEDQGGPAKVEAKPSRLYISRNYAEESQGILPNLHQKYASKLQAHKSMTTMMVNSFKEETPGFFRRFLNRILSTIKSIFKNNTTHQTQGDSGERDTKNIKSQTGHESTTTIDKGLGIGNPKSQEEHNSQKNPTETSRTQFFLDKPYGTKTNSTEQKPNEETPNPQCSKN